ncbi:MAG: alanyl-tRNA synthetase [Candidatus Thiodiazotropha sp. (ex Codakia rugifera)]|nr:alanyl-tRNA synthetase [Candidatus Thiodiazotropha sp. (ex Codakia rugifera)]
MSDHKPGTILPNWLRQVTLIGFTFFFAKGLLWLALAVWIMF